MGKPYRLRPPEARFFAKVKKTETCWVWLASKTPPGYGKFSMNYQSVYAHRWSYEYHRGVDIPKGLVIDHLCRNPPCVNPDHLDLVTCSENTLRGRVPEMNRARRKETCGRGHPLNEENTYHHTYADGRQVRQCRACNRINRESSPQ